MHQGAGAGAASRWHVLKLKAGEAGHHGQRGLCSVLAPHAPVCTLGHLSSVSPGLFPDLCEGHKSRTYQESDWPSTLAV